LLKKRLKGGLKLRLSGRKGTKGREEKQQNPSTFQGKGKKFRR